MSLITKIQYKNYEPGEFTAQKERTYEETIQLIESFPWKEQREHLVVSLTNPSVTIEGKNGDFLKLALYYNDKFVLYYLDANRHLFTRSSLHYQDAYPIIQAFFSDDLFEPSALKREHTPLQNNIVHFEEGDFTYQLKPATILTRPVSFGIIILLIEIAFVRTLILQSAMLLVLPMLIALLIAICIAIIYINHWKYAQGNVLILSRGKDIFFYGSAAAPDQYSKKDILDIATYGTRGRYGYPDTTRVEINFTNGHSIEISCLMIKQPDLILKFPGCTSRQIKEFMPFMPLSDASAPS